MLRRVALIRTDVSEEPGASFIRVTRIGELGTTQAATSNRRRLWSFLVHQFLSPWWRRRQVPPKRWICLAHDRDQWGSCGCGNERSGSRNFWGVREWLHNWWPFEQWSAPQSYVRCEVFMTVAMMNAVFWDVLVRTNDLEERFASIISVKRIRERHVPPKRRFLQKTHDDTSQKTVFSRALNSGSIRHSLLCQGWATYPSPIDNQLGRRHKTSLQQQRHLLNIFIASRTRE
jgi:hypothetical protein